MTDGPPPQRAEVASSLLQLVQRSLEDSKAFDPVIIDLMGRSSIADYMYIASGRSSRHIGAIADALLRTLKSNGYGRTPVEGRGDWVLIDAGDVVIHLFRPPVRAFYNLEKIWGAQAPLEKGTSTARIAYDQQK